MRRMQDHEGIGSLPCFGSTLVQALRDHVRSPRLFSIRQRGCHVDDGGPRRARPVAPPMGELQGGWVEVGAAVADECSAEVRMHVLDRRLGCVDARHRPQRTTLTETYRRRNVCRRHRKTCRLVPLRMNPPRGLLRGEHSQPPSAARGEARPMAGAVRVSLSVCRSQGQSLSIPGCACHSSDQPRSPREPATISSTSWVLFSRRMLVSWRRSTSDCSLSQRSAPSVAASRAPFSEASAPRIRS